MGGDPVPGPHEILRLWYKLRKLKGYELEQAIATLKEWLRKRGRGQAGRIIA